VREILRDAAGAAIFLEDFPGHAEAHDMPCGCDPLGQFCTTLCQERKDTYDKAAMNDPYAYLMVAAKCEHEGKQYGSCLYIAGGWQMLPDPLGVRAWADSLIEAISDCLHIPPEHRDADWLARFKVIVRPVSQAEMDAYLNLEDCS
jgi:hypothetical protein